MTPDSPGLRDLFVAAARELLDEPDTSLDLRKVAERAGKSRTAPYLAFGKAEEGGGLPALQLAVAADGFRELTDRMQEALGGARDPEEGLQAMATAYLAFARDRPRLFRLMFGGEVGAALASPSFAPPAAREQRTLVEARWRLESIVRSIVEAQAPGYVQGLETTDTATAAGAMWAMMHGVAILTIDEQWGMGELGGGREDPEEMAARALRFLTTASIRSLGGLPDSLHRAMQSKGLTFGGGLGRRERTGDVAPPGSLDPTFAREARGVREAREVREAQDVREVPHLREPQAGPMYGALESRPPDATDDAPGPGGEAVPSSILESSALRRARIMHPRVSGTRILWIDDEPEGVAHERSMLEGLGAEVVQARETWGALQVLEDERFDLAISDIRRGGVDDEGIRVLPALRALLGPAPVIFYVEDLLEEPGTPGGAFGITNDPEELLHLVLDVVERRPGGAAGGKGRGR